jgi:TetR/AcrR family transcriptional repressor of lmrAB and yxaGH operons
MARLANARDKVIETAEHLFRGQGYAATGLTQILTKSGAPKGSFYHYFPGGKEELASEVLTRYAARVDQGIKTLGTMFAANPTGFVAALFSATGKEMEANQWIGCAAQALVQELPPENRRLRRQVQSVYGKWIELVANALRSSCDSDHAAADLATLVVAALTGARTLARATHSQVPFQTTAEWLQASVFQPKK